MSEAPLIVHRKSQMVLIHAANERLPSSPWCGPPRKASWGLVTVNVLQQAISLQAEKASSNTQFGCGSRVRGHRIRAAHPALPAHLVPVSHPSSSQAALSLCFNIQGPGNLGLVRPALWKRGLTAVRLWWSAHGSRFSGNEGEQATVQETHISAKPCSASRMEYFRPHAPATHRSAGLAQRRCHARRNRSLVLRTRRVPERSRVVLSFEHAWASRPGKHVA